MKIVYHRVIGGTVLAALALFASNALLTASETDGRIETAFKQTYVYQTYLKDEKIKISAKDGAVTLSGTAKNAAEKDLVTKLVTDINGVKTVVNNMTVAPAASH